jgi:hypothetical protein
MSREIEQVLVHWHVARRRCRLVCLVGEALRLPDPDDLKSTLLSTTPGDRSVLSGKTF